ncbi:MAG: hypothetical protein HZC55_21095 [Verrucomicrobia bacterium]|nr:hypothetical protein [Verrucomicrobiota bacterium]
MPTPTSVSKLAVIFAGEDLTARLHDGSSLPVRVRAMPARHLGRVLALCTDEAALLDFVCLVPAAEGEAQPVPGWSRVPEGWADNLTDASHAELLEAAHRLNFSRAANWGRRQIAAKQFQAPLLLEADEALAPVVEKMTRLLLSSLPLSVPPGAPATRY